MTNPKRAGTPERSATFKARACWLTLACSGLLLLASASHAADPAWWQARGAITANANPAPNAVVNQGQLKQFTVSAVQELNASLASVGGAGDTLNGLVAGWQQDYATNAYATDSNNSSRPYKPADFDAVTVGQLKYIAGLIYGRLQSGGYVAAAPDWLTVNPAADSNLAVLGQLKSVFNFDLGLDPDGSGLSIAWENQYFGHTGVDPNADPDGDGLTNLQEFQLGANPDDFYNGQTPKLTVVSGTPQTGPKGGYVSKPLVVQICNAVGDPLVNAPVFFTVTSGDGLVQVSDSKPLVNAITMNTDGTGQASVFFQLPDVVNQTCHVTAAADGANQAQPADFVETSDDGSGAFGSPFAPSNFVAQGNPDGSVDLSWINHTDDPSGIDIEFLQADGSWKVVAQVPAGATSYHCGASH